MKLCVCPPFPPQVDLLELMVHSCSTFGINYAKGIPVHRKFWKCTRQTTLNKTRLRMQNILLLQEILNEFSLLSPLLFYNDLLSKGCVLDLGHTVKEMGNSLGGVGNM